MNSIYTEGSLTKAAEVVGITQPAVSNALSRLREKFEDELFVRTGRVYFNDGPRSLAEKENNNKREKGLL